MWYFHKTNAIIRYLSPSSLIWNKSRSEKNIYLTFDDGPIPDLTPKILDILDCFGVKATFFCVGENILKHPNIFLEIVSRGHGIGNHTFNHLNGWNTGCDDYLSNITKTQKVIEDMGVKTDLFRPPYGKITNDQAKVLAKKYDIVMWDVLSGDFDTALSKEKCLSKSLKYVSNGTIIVFHDNVKAEDNVLFALPRFINKCLKENYMFEKL